MPPPRAPRDIPVVRALARCPACATWGRLPVAAWDGAFVVWCPCCGPVVRIHCEGHRAARAEDMAAELVALHRPLRPPGH